MFALFEEQVTKESVNFVQELRIIKRSCKQLLIEVIHDINIESILMRNWLLTRLVRTPHNALLSMRNPPKPKEVIRLQQ